ncbi:MAG: hydroxymethylbilane synthase [Acidobacteria bacterium]|nr:hydroxymethylbilane synthase [Acidobacteriota bacterium]
MKIRAATRGSELALWQTRHVAALLSSIDPSIEVEEVVVSTTGDRRLDVAIHEIGGKGVFVKEVQAAVLDGRADVAVHSGKDLPAMVPDGLVVAAVPTRADPRDVLIGAGLDSLGPRSVVATGSVRRRVQLATLVDGLSFCELRGNVGSRLARAHEFDAIVLAAAGLDRLGHDPQPSQRLSIDQMVPQVAQGALAVECRADNTELHAVLATIEDRDTRVCFDTERAFLLELGGDCSMPAGAHATWHGDEIACTGILSVDERSVPLRVSERGHDPAALGRSVARALVGRR